MKHISLSAFFEHTETAVFSEQKKSYCFFGAKELEPLLFCALLRDFLKKKELTSTALDVTANRIAHTYTTLSTSFLGMSASYWLKNITELDAKGQAALLAFLFSYQGPHQIFFFMPELEVQSFNDAWVPVELPFAIEHTVFVRLCASFGKPLSPKSRQLSLRVWAKHKVVPLETACILMQYLAVLGSSDDASVLQLLNNLVDTKSSLFTLSGHFFAKQPEPFFNYWKVVASEYQEIFWISFWTEQVWRAHYVVKNMKEKQPLDAKKIGFRLPFSFLQRDWRLVSQIELQRAHQFLYEADFQLKNGGSGFCLEMFFANFMSGAFAKI